MLTWTALIFGGFAIFFFIKKLIGLPTSSTYEMSVFQAVLEPQIMNKLKECLADKKWLTLNESRVEKMDSDNYRTEFYIKRDDFAVALLAVYWNSKRRENVFFQMGNCHESCSPTDPGSFDFFFKQINRFLRQSRFMKIA